MIALLKSFWRSLCPADDLTPRERKLAQWLADAEKAGHIHLSRNGAVSLNLDNPEVIAQSSHNLKAVATLVREGTDET